VQPPPSPLALLVDPHCPASRIQALTTALGLEPTTAPGPGMVLRLSAERLELGKPDDPHLPGSLWVDFTRPDARRRALQPGRELLIQAAKVRRTASPLVIDATAGLGRDGFLLAAAGFRVQLFESNPVVAALLRDGLERASRAPALAAIVARMQLVVGNALDLLPLLSDPPEVIYLDPMFPPRSKAAKVKQDLQLLQLLQLHDQDPVPLLQAALAIRVRKVVVKRPLKGPALAGPAPSYTLRGKAIRFDVYVGG